MSFEDKIELVRKVEYQQKIIFVREELNNLSLKKKKKITLGLPTLKRKFCNMLQS